MLDIGTQAPNPTIQTHDDYSGPLGHFWQDGPLILFFYPKDDTIVCTKEACTFQNSFNEFQSFNANVVGCSTDSLDSHKKFAQGNNLSFPIVVDEKGEFSNTFKTLRPLLRICKRVTSVIGSDGTILGRTHNELSVNDHMKMIRATLDKLPKS